MAVGTTLAIASLALAAGGAVTSAVQAGKAKKNAKEQGRQLQFAEQSRQEIVDPYAGIKDVSSIATDLSSKITNPFANLQVATKAAEMQAAETDISLASSLDALRATGMGAGGATALAQAAARSKQGVSASIEQQEAQNARLRAQGEQQMQQMQMQEAARIQSIKLSEAQRVQQAQAAGKEFMFSAQETREMQRLNRLAGLQANYLQQQSQARAGIASSLGSAAQVGATIATAG